MADEAPDFTFDPTQDPALDALVPVYTAILGPGGKPTVSLGAVTRDVAETWLVRQHKRYADAIGKRSHLIQKMDLRQRVTLVDLTDG